MNIALIVYFASISGNVQGLLGFAGLLCLCSLVALVGIGDHKWLWKIPAFFVPLGVLLFTFCALIPSEKDIYKIAGVTDQQKASIDATGAVIQNGAKK